MKVFPLVSACFVQLLAQRVAASGLIVELNQDLAVDRRVLLSTHGAARLTSGNVLAADDGDDTLTDRDYFLRDHPGATWPWDNEGPVDLPPLAEVATPEGATPAEEAAAPADATPVENSTTAAEEVAVSLVSRELVAISLEKTIQCSNTDSTPSGPPVNVLVLISDCSLADIPWIEAWVDNLANEDSRYFARGAASKIKYTKRYVDGCGKNLGGGRVKFNKNERKPDNTVATIAFITGENSYDKVQKYVNDEKIDTLIGFQNANTLSKKMNGFNYYTSKETLDALNPYSAVRLLHCAGLANGVPTSYVDDNGKRQCYCSCPSGYKLVGKNKCVADPDQKCDCVWKQDEVYKFLIKKDEEALYEDNYGECSITSLVGTGFLPVPLVVDNYVAHHRDNLRDADVGPYMTGPRLELQQTKEEVSVEYGRDKDKEPRKSADLVAYTWKDFQQNSADRMDEITLKKVGKYSLQLTAWDYGLKNAQCEACVLVIDKRRPNIHRDYTCPATAKGDTKTALTKTNVENAQKAINAVKTVKDKAENDACGTNHRCDRDSQKLKKFVDPDYCEEQENHNGIGSLFSEDTVRTDLKNKLSGSPFDSTKPNGLAASVQDECKRCAVVGTQLKEWWTPYTCERGPVASLCEGDADAKCDTEQCVKVNGETLATATSTIKTDIAANSKNVVKNLNDDANTNDAALAAKYSLGNTIHVALECSEYLKEAPAAGKPDACSYTKEVSDLIDISASWAALGTDALFQQKDDDVNTYVSWHYQVDGGKWKAWDATKSSDSETFYKAEATITVQAWTKCGMVKEFKYYVKLHLNNPVQVCDHFSKMWYQTTSPPLLSTPNSFCMFPKSDFAEVTFDYHPNIGLNFNVAKFQMSISKVVCTMKYSDRAAVTVVDTGSIDKSLKSFEIVKQFAIDGVDTKTTAEDTEISIECEFTYARKADDKTVSHKCPLDIVIKDCSPPVISKPCELDGHCEFNKCSIAGSPDRDLYQACDGNRVTQDSTTGATQLVTGSAKCCESCDTEYKPTCVAIQDFPNGKKSQFTPIKRCEAISTAPYQPYDLMAASVTNEAQVAQVQGHAMTALLGASAMVAVVALVVVVRRRTVAKAAVTDEAYYALLG